MIETIYGIIGITIGLGLILFRKPFSRLVIKSQNTTWGFNFGEREVKISEYVAIIVGAGSIIFGLAGIFHLAKLK